MGQSEGGGGADQGILCLSEREKANRSYDLGQCFNTCRVSNLPHGSAGSHQAVRFRDRIEQGNKHAYCTGWLDFSQGLNRRYGDG